MCVFFRQTYHSWVIHGSFINLTVKLMVCHVEKCLLFGIFTAGRGSSRTGGADAEARDCLAAGTITKEIIVLRCNMYIYICIDIYIYIYRYIYIYGYIYDNNICSYK